MGDVLPVIVKHFESPGCMDVLWPYIRLALAFVGGALLGYAYRAMGG